MISLGNIEVNYKLVRYVIFFSPEMSSSPVVVMDRASDWVHRGCGFCPEVIMGKQRFSDVGIFKIVIKRRVFLLGIKAGYRRNKGKMAFFWASYLGVVCMKPKYRKMKRAAKIVARKWHV